MSRLLNHTTRLFGTAVLASCLGLGGTMTNAYAITEQEAQDIAVDAYVYFYPIVSLDVTRKQFTNLEPGKVPGRGPMNMFNNVPTYPPGDDKGVVRQLRHALFVGLPRPLQGTDGGLGAGYRRALLPPADARHVDRRVRVAGLAHDGNAGR